MSDSQSKILAEKWEPVLNLPELPEIKDEHRRSVTATMLENTKKALEEGSAWSPNSLLMEAPNVAGDGTGNVKTYDPVLISLVRRAMPNLIAYDVCGVQPMTGPSGLIFAMRAQYANSTAMEGEALFDEADTTEGGDSTGTQSGATGSGAVARSAAGMSTSVAEANSAFNEMGFTIDKVTAVATSRAMKAEYTSELAQDLKAIHGLDADKELANILTAELLSEINREVVRAIYTTANTGGAGLTTPGTFDCDADSSGRWSAEKFKGLHFQLEREANAIAKSTRRGKGNMILCSSDVASALQMAGVLDYSPALSTSLNVDDTGNTFAGLIGGRTKVYIDPYAAGDFAVVGFRGASQMDAGLFYCPYVPLQMMRAVGENSFQPKIAFKTRYALVANPFATAAGDGVVDAYDGTVGATNQNKYYRRLLITNIM